MTLLMVGLVLFLGAHSINIVRPTLRAAAIERIGLMAWQGLYALPALLGLILIGSGYDAARESASALLLYEPPFWLRHVALLLLVPVFPLLFATYLPGRIQAAVKHPTLAAVKLWALAHLCANGTAADVVLFGSFLIWAIADRISLQRRVSLAPVSGAPARWWNDVFAVIAGLCVYILFLLYWHNWLIGVAPLP